jgi:SRSO17 transposase
MPRPTASSTCSDAPCGKAGKVQNCRIGVLLTHASHLGQTLLGRALYLPAAEAKSLPGTWSGIKPRMTL